MKFNRFILKDIASVQTGPFGSQLHKSDYIEGGTPIITVEHLGENRIIHKNLPGVKDEDVKRLSKYGLIKNDIVFSRVGSVDRRAIVTEAEEGWLFSGRCLRVRVTSELVNPVYLSYYFGLSSFKEYIRNIAVGATMPSINTKILSNIELSLPNISTQNEIANLLSTVDLKIWNNEKIISNLEQLAQTLFKHWFVDFEFPNENGEPYRSSGGKIVESELGMIPEMWEIETLGSILQLVKESVKPGEETKSKPYVPIDVLPMKKLTFFDSKSGNEAKSSLIRFNQNDILLGAMRVYFHRVCLAPFDGTTRTTSFVLRPINMEYLFYSLLTLFQKDTIDFAESSSRGTTIPYAVWKNGLEIFKITVPTFDVAKKFNGLLKPMFDQIMVTNKAIKELKELRDTLLPKLLAGELELPIDENEVTDNVPIS